MVNTVQKISQRVGSIDNIEKAKYNINEPIDPQIFIRIGSKRCKLGDLIRRAIPNGDIYIEPFGGTFAIGKDLGNKFNKRIYNDIDPYAVQLITELSKGNAYKICKALQDVEYSSEYLLNSLNQFYTEKDPIMKAKYAWVILTQSKFGNGRLYKFKADDRERFKYIYSLDARYKLSYLFDGIEVRNEDAIELIKDYDKPGVVMYIDPPYILYNNDKNSLYCQTWGTDKQVELLEVLKNLKNSKVLLSGYNNSLYDKALQNWNKYSINDLSKLLDDKEYNQYDLEVVWQNYDIQSK